MRKEIDIRQYKAFDFLVSEFEFNLTNAEYFDGYAGIESVWYENRKRDIRVNVIHDHRGEVDIIVEKIENGQKFSIDQIARFCDIWQLYYKKNQEVKVKDVTNSFPLKYSFKVQFPRKMCELANSLKDYVAFLFKEDDCFLSQLSEYCVVVNGLYTQNCTKDKRDNGVTQLIENAIRNGDFKNAHQLLLGLSLPLCHYEEKALVYVEKILG